MKGVKVGDEEKKTCFLMMIQYNKERKGVWVLIQCLHWFNVDRWLKECEYGFR
jgi:hypothetical protein